MEKDYMLTTYDNPISPFDDNFEAWWKEDLRLGHNTCGLLAKYSDTSPLFGDEINEQSINAAMEEIIRLNPTLYRKVLREDYKVS